MIAVQNCVFMVFCDFRVIKRLFTKATSEPLTVKPLVKLCSFHKTFKAYWSRSAEFPMAGR
jgi:hypothetical protein